MVDVTFWFWGYYISFCRYYIVVLAFFWSILYWTFEVMFNFFVDIKVILSFLIIYIVIISNYLFFILSYCSVFFCRYYHNVVLGLESRFFSQIAPILSSTFLFFLPDNLINTIKHLAKKSKKSKKYPVL